MKRELKIFLRVFVVLLCMATSILALSTGFLYEYLTESNLPIEQNFNPAGISLMIKGVLRLFLFQVFLFTLTGLLCRKMCLLFAEKLSIEIPSRVKTFVIVLMVACCAAFYFKQYAIGQKCAITAGIFFSLLSIYTLLIALWPGVAVRFFNWIRAAAPDRSAQ